MDQFIVPQVKAPVNGEVEISGAKNAVLAVMAAALLAEGVSEITNVPHLKDMKTMSDVLRVDSAAAASRSPADAPGARALWTFTSRVSKRSVQRLPSRTVTSKPLAKAASPAVTSTSRFLASAQRSTS